MLSMYSPFLTGRFGCINASTISYFASNMTSFSLLEVARVAVLPSFVPILQRRAMIDCMFSLAEVQSGPLACKYLSMTGFATLKSGTSRSVLWTMAEVYCLDTYGVTAFITRFGVSKHSTRVADDPLRTRSSIDYKLRDLSIKANPGRPSKGSSVKVVVKNGMPAWFNKDHSFGVDLALEELPNRASINKWNRWNEG